MWIAPSGFSPLIQFMVFPGTPLETASQSPPSEVLSLLPFRQPPTAGGCALNRFAHWELAGTSLRQTFSNPHVLSSDAFLRIGGVTLASDSTASRSPVDLLLASGMLDESSLRPDSLMTLSEDGMRELGLYAQVSLDPSADTLTLESRRAATDDLVQSQTVPWNKKGRVEAILEKGRDEIIAQSSALIAETAGSENARLRATMALNGVWSHVVHFLAARESDPHQPIGIDRTLLKETEASLREGLLPEISSLVLADEAVLFETVLRWWRMEPPAITSASPSRPFSFPSGPRF